MMGFGISVDGGTTTEAPTDVTTSTDPGDPLGLGSISSALHVDMTPLASVLSGVQDATAAPAPPPPPAISLNLGGLLARNGMASFAPATPQSAAVDASKAAVAAGAAPSTPFYKQPAVLAAGAAVVAVGVGRALWRHFHR